MRQWRLRIAALVVLLAFWAGTAPVAAQLDLNDLGPPWPQPTPVQPFIELDVTVGANNWRQFFTALVQANRAQRFAPYPFSLSPSVDHVVGMALWRDDLLVSLYNREEAPDIFVVGLFKTNLPGDAEPVAAAFLQSLAGVLKDIPGGRIGDNYADPAKAAQRVLRPPLRVAEISVPTDYAGEMMTRIRDFARRGGFFWRMIYPDRRFRLLRYDLWRTELKIVIENPTRTDKFVVTISSYLPLPNVPQEELERLTNLCIAELGNDVAKIPGGVLTVKE